MDSLQAVFLKHWMYCDSSFWFSLSRFVAVLLPLEIDIGRDCVSLCYLFKKKIYSFLFDRRFACLPLGFCTACSSGSLASSSNPPIRSWYHNPRIAKATSFGGPSQMHR